jgi:CheY-like chemotaxis protein
MKLDGVATQKQQAPADDAQLKGNASIGSRRILVVDDSVDSCEILATFLKSKGHAVCTACDGIDGLTAAGRFCPEIAFLDIRMPRMSGIELCVRLRAEPATKDAAVFALTAGPFSGLTAAGAPGRFDAYLRKPVELDVIDSLISCTSQCLQSEGANPGM